MIAFLDVGYEGSGVRAPCVLADSWESALPHATYVREINAIEPYEPGSFFVARCLACCPYFDCRLHTARVRCCGRLCMVAVTSASRPWSLPV